MSVKSKLLAAFAAVALPVSAHAVVLDFDSMAAGVYKGPYSESGFTFELDRGSDPHFGDGGAGGTPGATASGTLSWHDDGANGDDVLNILTQNNSAAFDFTSFDLIAGSVSILGSTYSAPGTYVLNLAGITSLAFDVLGGFGAGVAIDNVVVSAANVPEPTTLALFGLGLAGLGVSRSRKA